MSRPKRPHRQQLALRFAAEPDPSPPCPPLCAQEPLLMQTLADLLLEALGRRDRPSDGAVPATEAADERQDHA